MGTIDANACRPGTKVLIDGEPYAVLERAHHKPGKGGAFVRFKLKGVISGKVIDHTVRAGTKLQEADVMIRPMQYLYQQADDFVFMDQDSFDQIPLSKELMGFAVNFLIEGAVAQVTLYDGRAIGVQLPQKMVFEVTDTIDNPAMGNTATNVQKDATIETGYVVQVPPFIKVGEKIRLLTEDGSYLERANE